MVAITFIIILPITMSYGYLNAKLNVKYTTVANNIEIYEEVTALLPEAYKANALVVLYKSGDSIIVSPCSISDDEIIIYSDYQRVLPYDEQVYHYDTYQNHAVK